MIKFREEFEKTINNQTKAEIIKKAHAIRLKLLEAIERCDKETYEKDLKDAYMQYFRNDDVDLMKRVNGNQIRSYKNILLSLNSLYGFFAEKGGLCPVLSHYMSEKYAIMIEAKNSIDELTKLHEYFLRDFGNPANRNWFYKNESLSNRVLQYISANFMNEINISYIADKFFVTRVHLMRTFKKETGTTINDAIISKRFEEACHLLKHSNLPVTEIALMVGFNSSQHFSRLFNKKFGMTPKTYRNEKGK